MDLKWTERWIRCCGARPEKACPPERRGAHAGARVRALDADELSAFAEGALPVAARAAYVSHLADCDECGRRDGACAVGGRGRQLERSAAAEGARQMPWPLRGLSVCSALFAPRNLRSSRGARRLSGRRHHLHRNPLAARQRLGHAPTPWVKTLASPTARSQHDIAARPRRLSRLTGARDDANAAANTSRTRRRRHSGWLDRWRPIRSDSSDTVAALSRAGGGRRGTRREGREAAGRPPAPSSPRRRSSRQPSKAVQEKRGLRRPPVPGPPAFGGSRRREKTRALPSGEGRSERAATRPFGEQPVPEPQDSTQLNEMTQRRKRRRRAQRDAPPRRKPTTAAAATRPTPKQGRDGGARVSRQAARRRATTGGVAGRRDHERSRPPLPRQGGSGLTSSTKVNADDRVRRGTDQYRALVADLPELGASPTSSAARSSSRQGQGLPHPLAACAGNALTAKTQRSREDAKGSSRSLRLLCALAVKGFLPSASNRRTSVDYSGRASSNPNEGDRNDLRSPFPEVEIPEIP